MEDIKVKVYIIVISSVAIVYSFLIIFNYLSSNLYYFRLSQIKLLIFIILLLSRFFSEIFPIEYFPDKKNHAEITLSIAFTILIAFVFNPFYAILLVMITEIASNIYEHKEWYKIIFNTSVLIIAVGLTSYIFLKYYNYSRSFLSPKNLLVLAIAGTLNFILESGLLFGLLSILNKKNILYFWWKNLKQISLEICTLYPLGFLLIYLYTTNFLAAILLIPVFFAIYAASKEKMQIISQTEKTLYTLVQLEENKFPETREHSERVSNLALLLCKKLGIGESDTEIIIKAAKLHDIGKISVPDYIIKKPDKLNKEEWQWIKAHPENGYKLLKNISMFMQGAKIVRYHHERWNGSGYPKGLKANEIPKGAQIIAIIDSFDAMITPRAYKKEIKTILSALKELEEDGKNPEDKRLYNSTITKKFIMLIKEIINNPEIMHNPQKRSMFFSKQAKIK